MKCRPLYIYIYYLYIFFFMTIVPIGLHLILNSVYVGSTCGIEPAILSWLKAHDIDHYAIIL